MKWLYLRLAKTAKTISSKHTEKEIRVITLFTRATNNIKIGIDLSNKMNNLYNKKFKSLKKKLKAISEDRKISHAQPWVGQINVD